MRKRPIRRRSYIADISNEIAIRIAERKLVLAGWILNLFEAAIAVIDTAVARKSKIEGNAGRRYSAS